MMISGAVYKGVPKLGVKTIPFMTREPPKSPIFNLLSVEIKIFWGLISQCKILIE